MRKPSSPSPSTSSPSFSSQQYQQQQREEKNSFLASSTALLWRHRWHAFYHSLFSRRKGGRRWWWGGCWRVLKIVTLVALSWLLGYGFFALVGVRHAHLLRGESCRLPPLSSVPSSSRRQRLAIVTLHESERFRRIGELSSSNKERYANIHNYTLFVDSHLVDMKQRRPSWMKVAAVRSHLTPPSTVEEGGSKNQTLMSYFDWVMWMDADALFMNFEEEARLERVLDSDYDMVFTKDRNGINAGVWFARNTEWSRRFLQAWWDKTDWIRPPDSPKSPSGDQHALHELLHQLHEDGDNDDDYDDDDDDVGEVLGGSGGGRRRRRRRHVKYVPQCWFNSYATFRGWSLEGVWMKGDLVIHIAGHGLADKQRLLEAFYHNHIYPYYNFFTGD